MNFIISLIAISFIILVVAFVITLVLRQKKRKGPIKECTSGDRDRNACKDLVKAETGVKDAYRLCVNDFYTSDCIVECSDKNATYDYQSGKCQLGCIKNNDSACSSWLGEGSGVKNAYIKCESGKYVPNSAFSDGCTVECTNPNAKPDEKTRICIECNSNDRESCKAWKGGNNVKDAYIRCDKGRYIRSNLEDGCTVECSGDKFYPDLSSHSCISYTEQIDCNTSEDLLSPLMFIKYIKNTKDDLYFIGKDNKLFTSSNDNILKPENWASFFFPLGMDSNVISESFIFTDISNEGYYLSKDNSLNYFKGTGRQNNILSGISDLASYYDKSFYIITLTKDNKIIIYKDEIASKDTLPIFIYTLPSVNNVIKIFPFNLTSFYLLTTDNKVNFFDSISNTVSNIKLNFIPNPNFDITFNYSTRKFIFSSIQTIPKPYLYSGIYNLVSEWWHSSEPPSQIIVNMNDSNTGKIIFNGGVFTKDPYNFNVIPCTFGKNCYDKNINVLYAFNFYIPYLESIGHKEVAYLGLGACSPPTCSVNNYILTIPKVGYFVRVVQPDSKLVICTN